MPYLHNVCFRPIADIRGGELFTHPLHATNQSELFSRSMRRHNERVPDQIHDELREAVEACRRLSDALDQFPQTETLRKLAAKLEASAQKLDMLHQVPIERKLA